MRYKLIRKNKTEIISNQQLHNLADLTNYDGEVDLIKVSENFELGFKKKLKVRKIILLK